MRLEINDYTLNDYIRELKINKKSDLLICIPTFNSFEVTSSTIKKFYTQKDVKFDILVTGPSGDVEKIYQKFPNVNYCLTKDNYGGSGNQLINIYLSKVFKYEFFMLTDNDAFLLEDNGLKSMLDTIKKEDLVWVYPMYSGKNIRAAFHCSVYSSKIFEKIDYFYNSNYFVFYDDTAFSKRIEFNFKDRVKAVQTSYFHPQKLEKSCFDLKQFYIITRSALIFIFREKFPLMFKLKMSYWRSCLTFITYFFVKYNFEFLRLFLKASLEVIKNDYDNEFLNSIQSKIKYKEVNSTELLNKYSNIDFKLIFHQRDTLLNPKAFKYLEIDNSYKYFIKIN